MSLAVDVASDGVRAPLSKAAVAAIARATLRAERVGSAHLSITFVSARAIASLNARWLGHRGPTDVISFQLPAAAPDASLTGDVYIAPEVARENARAAGLGTREELARLVVHGTLHVVGHDHPEGDARLRSPMWRRQEQLVTRTAREWRR
ncbi:MAG TPA: rRNA maturation RNase YbeY [Gemmatimonadaceae bacterium]|nr:rRNA maturation RNase YbeY [Gemmatimonadaceae bacterium]